MLFESNHWEKSCFLLRKNDKKLYAGQMIYVKRPVPSRPGSRGSSVPYRPVPSRTVPYRPVPYRPVPDPAAPLSRTVPSRLIFILAVPSCPGTGRDGTDPASRGALVDTRTRVLIKEYSWFVANDRKIVVMHRADVFLNFPLWTQNKRKLCIKFFSKTNLDAFKLL